MSTSVRRDELLFREGRRRVHESGLMMGRRVFDALRCACFWIKNAVFLYFAAVKEGEGNRKHPGALVLLLMALGTDVR